MTFLRTSLVLFLAGITLAGSQYVDLKRSFKVNQYTSVVDGNDKLVGKRQVSLIVWGDFNKTTDNAAISSFVHDKVKFAQHQPQELLLDQEMGLDQLPLQVNLTVTEMVQVGPRPMRNMALWLSVQIYHQKKHHDDAVDILSTMEPELFD